MRRMIDSSTTASGFCGRGAFLTVLSASVLLVGALTLFQASPAQANPAVIVKANEKPKTRFTPDKVTIKVGEEVEWDNVGKIPHRVLSEGAGKLPAGAKTFDSMFILPGKKFVHKFDVPGAYHYVCDFHSATGMRGEVDVTK